MLDLMADAMRMCNSGHGSSLEIVHSPDGRRGTTFHPARLLRARWGLNDTVEEVKEYIEQMKAFKKDLEA